MSHRDEEIRRLPERTVSELRDLGLFWLKTPSAVRVFVVPKARAEVIDNWHVAGLRGTDSPDWRVESVFVPDG